MEQSSTWGYRKSRFGNASSIRSCHSAKPTIRFEMLNRMFHTVMVKEADSDAKKWTP
ncbi:hypothetical protein RB2726 [Rhodopirellula baltica SH 1]|uniref:Uncharacterized protein n=1 Tax=Rhodopirellula baltica (strain DSM 10527 / NCIMB 13988 / SH1) TaxID=243090 RepID=Q7UVC3_RHOBA|nr:hypothetical protein RB2726 [Rhodopirellula baltica SH 1]